jgi:hypothetical protein
MSGSLQRRTQLAAGLAAVDRRIDGALASSGRTERPALVVVTKFFPPSDVDLLAELGVSDVGENRDQEAAAKFAEVAHRPELTLHFIGQLQSNKAGSVARYADVVQSVDRPKLVLALARGAEAADRTLDALVQVSLDDAPGRGGVPWQEAVRLADAIAGVETLRLRGVMAVAPLGAEPRAAFARLREVSEQVRRAHPEAFWISAGMSGDLEEAIAEGATHLRVGTAILGSRPPLG